MVVGAVTEGLVAVAVPLTEAVGKPEEVAVGAPVVVTLEEGAGMASFLMVKRAE